MSDEHSVSRRTSLKSFGAMGAAVVVGSAMPSQDVRKPAGSEKDATTIVNELLNDAPR